MTKKKIRLSVTRSGSLRMGGDIFARKCGVGYDLWVRDKSGWFPAGLWVTKGACVDSMKSWAKELGESENGYVIKPSDGVLDCGDFIELLRG